MSGVLGREGREGVRRFYICVASRVRQIQLFDRDVAGVSVSVRDLQQSFFVRNNHPRHFIKSWSSSWMSKVQFSSSALDRKSQIRSNPRQQRPNKAVKNKKSRESKRTARDSLPSITWEQTAAAESQYEAMCKFVDCLPVPEQITSQSKPVISSHQLREAFRFWLSRPAARVANQKGERRRPIQSARRILDYAEFLSKDESLHKTIPHIFYDMESPNGGLCRLIGQYLVESFQSTYAALEMHGSRSQRIHFVSPEDRLDALYQATEVVGFMERLHRDPRFPRMIPDECSHTTLCNLWSKRAIFCSQTSHVDRPMLDADKMSLALGGATSARECIDNIKSLLKRLKENDETPDPTLRMYVILLTSLAHSQDVGTNQEALDVLLEVEETHPEPLPIQMYAPVLLAFTREATRDPASEAVVVNLFSRMQQSSNPAIVNDPIAYSILMNMYAKLGKPDDCERLLYEMETRASTTSSVDKYPTLIHFNIAIHAWAKSLDDRAPRKVQDLIGYMHETERMEGRPSIAPDRISYTSAIEAVLQSGKRDAIKTAELLLTKSEQSLDKRIIADQFVYDAILNTLSKRQMATKNQQDRENIARAMERFFFRMKKRWLSPSTPQLAMPPPDVRIYHHCLDAWARSYSPRAGERAYALLREIQRNFVIGASPTRPDILCFDLFLQCLSLSNSAEAAQLASGVIKQIQGEFKDIPVSTFNHYLRVLAHSDCDDQLARAEVELQQQESLFQQGKSRLRPNDTSYYTIIRGYSKRANLKEAERLFSQMKQIGTQPDRIDVLPTAATYSALLEAYGRTQDPRNIDRVQELFDELRQRQPPTAYIYATYQSVLSRLGLVDAPQRVEAVLTAMQGEHDTTKNQFVRPDVHNFAIVINTWAAAAARMDDAAERAHAILQRMIELSLDQGVKPNAACYKGAIMAWALCNNEPAAGERALAILQDMRNNHAAMGTPQPDSACYKFALIATGRSHWVNGKLGVEAAYDLLQTMKEDHESGINRYAVPSSDHFRAVLRSCALVNDSVPNSIKKRYHDVAHQAISEFLATGSADDDPRVTQVIHDYYAVTCRKCLPPGKLQEHEALDQTLAK
jgi:pentatricopeptide repeat protein